jgi:hypothetical protein
MKNIRKIREHVSNAENYLGQIESGELPQKESLDFWKLAQRELSNARALANMDQVKSKNSELTGDRMFFRRAVTELIDNIEKDAMKITF